MPSVRHACPGRIRGVIAASSTTYPHKTRAPVGVSPPALRADADQLSHDQSKIEAAGLNQQRCAAPHAASGRQSRPPVVGVESLAQALNLPVDIMPVADVIQSRVERVGDRARQIGVATHIEACFACRGVCPLSSSTVSYA